ncbi:acyl-CoA thioesterase [Streptomyces sp. NPDC048504]|uniref:acyl-CoA thioesterase n=1 Tax=Streptomyces sp. NPDC048504 TaxID=3365559 RepID=UPI00371E398A
MSEPFSVPVTVRGYETDSLGHLNQSVYLQYAEHARWALLQAAGVGQAELLGQGVAPVVLETTIRYLRELRAGEDVEVSCVFEWGEGKTFRVLQTITKTDGTVSAEAASVGGLLDLEQRKLVAQPQEFFRKLTTNPSLFGL